MLPRVTCPPHPTPLGATCQVELTLKQKKTYRAVLEGNRELLVSAGSAQMPSLVNLQMELRKACNHPWLIKGVEDSDTNDLGEDQTFLDVLLKTSGKCVLLDKLLPKLKAEGHRVLIFSQVRHLPRSPQLAPSLGRRLSHHALPCKNSFNGHLV